MSSRLVLLLSRNPKLTCILLNTKDTDELKGKKNISLNSKKFSNYSFKKMNERKREKYQKYSNKDNTLQKTSPVCNLYHYT